MKAQKIKLMIFLFIVSCLVSVPASAANTDISTQALFTKLTDSGYLTPENASRFLDSLTFDDVFTSLTGDEVLSAVVKNGLAKDGNDMNTLFSRLTDLGFDVMDLRADGMLTVLAVNDLLKQNSLETKNALCTAFGAGKTTFLDALTRRHVLQMLEDDHKTSATDGQKKFIAYASWVTVNPALNLNNLTTPFNLNTGSENYIQEAVNTTNAQIAKGFLATIRIHDNIAYDMDDNWNTHVFDEVDPYGNPAEFLTIWMDRWAEKMHNRLDNYFRAYRDAGGKLDMLILDFEDGGMYFKAIRSRQEKNHLPIPTGKTIWQTIQEDSRWTTVRDRLGFDASYDLNQAVNWESPAGILQAADNLAKELKWNTVMDERLSKYLAYAFDEPLKKYFPNAKCSNYCQSHWNQTMPSSWDMTWAILWNTIGAIPKGWYQSNPFYGSQGFLGMAPFDETWTLSGWTRNGAQTWDNSYPYPNPKPACVALPSNFNSLIYMLASFRRMVTTSNTPTLPWIADPFYGNLGPYYTEMLDHLALNGVIDFLYWNPLGTDSIHQQVNRILLELDEMIGYENRKTLSLTAITYENQYLLTGMSAGGRRVWRFTPRIDLTVNPAYTVQSALIANQPATFQLIDGSTVTIPNSQIYRPAVGESSNLGYWVVQEAPASFLSDTADNVFKKIFPLSMLPGDVDGDGMIIGHDAALTAKAAVDLITLTADQSRAADVSGDGNVSAYDAALISQKVVNLIDKFPVEGS